VFLIISAVEFLLPLVSPLQRTHFNIGVVCSPDGEVYLDPNLQSSSLSSRKFSLSLLFPP